MVPLVEVPAIKANSFLNNHGADHNVSFDLLPFVRPIKNIVDPYIIIISPVSFTPTLIASAAASIVPTVTGVPCCKVVSNEACFVIYPAISVDHFNSGSLDISIISFESSLLHLRFNLS